MRVFNNYYGDLYGSGNGNNDGFNSSSGNGYGDGLNYGFGGSGKGNGFGKEYQSGTSCNWDVSTRCVISLIEFW